ncbi:hypothetical protein PPL_09286 [Heterostelium album PN500]|uniref:Uncharacterized protein n=1 Tax=Heterostelium pallidum (strain ATCC 26659 / Pp 5 / PN500) TaxID=670386 RepID=D3BL54_HETP5|nr:hypothetical protein PPL_09286 [Heterostelium album PN500]EFA77788.1 hypothetical protein PPL_09286 [Heterostelium album PN500]|eukprot:XP_020429916.1 hypothetical protein PPL_09286 [Heterostelium album PN500]
MRILHLATSDYRAMNWAADHGHLEIKSGERSCYVDPTVKPTVKPSSNNLTPLDNIQDALVPADSVALPIEEQDIPIRNIMSRWEF